MKEPNDNSIELELQVRLLNLVLGEVSDFERDQLQQLMEQRPELAEYLQHLEHLHGLIGEVGGGEWVMDDDPSKADDAWQLSPARRQHLLAVLDGVEPQPQFAPPVFKHKRWFGTPRWNVAILAVCASGLLLIGLLSPSVHLARKLPARFYNAHPGEIASFQGGTNIEWTLDEELHSERLPPIETSEAYQFQLGSDGSSPPADAPILGKSRYIQPRSGQSEGGIANGVEGNRGNELGLAIRVETSDLRLGGTVLGRSSHAEGAGMGGPRGYDPKAAGLGGVPDGKGGMGSGGMGGGMGDLAFGQNTPSAASDKSSSPGGQNSAGAIRGIFRGGQGASHNFDTKSELTLPSLLPEFRGLSSSATDRTERSPSGERHTDDFVREGFHIEDEPRTAKPMNNEEFDRSDLVQDNPFGEPLFRHSIEAVRLSEMAELDLAASVPQFGGFQVIPKEAPVLRFPISATDSENATQAGRQLRELNRESNSVLGLDRFALDVELKIEERKEEETLSRNPLDGIDEQTAAVDPFSTFSLHVSDVSFLLAQEALNQGQLPDASSIRIEEFVNAFDYGDPLPGTDQKVACLVEQAIHPFLINRNLLRVSMRTSSAGRASNTPLRLTLLLDNSGSMERPDRRQIVRRGLQSLTQQLSDSDQVTLISFANVPRLLADKVLGSQGETLQQIVENLPGEGGTNIESALLLAGEKALEQKLDVAQNRIVMMTDGAVNLGDADPNRLAGLVTQLRDAGIAFDAAGIGAHGLNDQVLEALTRQGDGRYYLLNSVEAASDSFSSQIAGALRPSAKNVKVQVEFNPQRVGNYKLLGFEKHRLNQEDFRNDAVDAAEMAAAEAGVALYHFEAKPDGQGDVGSVSVRFQDQDTGQMIEQRWPIPYEPNAPRLDQANPSIRIATAAALLAAKLRSGPLAEAIDLGELSRVLSMLPERESNQPRVQQLRTMIQQAKGE